MSIMSNLYTGVSGLSAFSVGIRSVGDNLANLNTVGFKKSRTNFQDLMNQMVLGGSGFQQVGRGTSVGDVQQIFNQGSLQVTQVNTDLAIEGGGFLVLEDPDGQQVFSRAGQLRIDNAGQLVNGQGLPVQGFSADRLGNVLRGQGIGAIDVGGATSPAEQTRLVQLYADLDPRDPAHTFDVADPEGTSSLSYSVTVTDPAGGQHELRVFFSRSDEDSWEYNVMAVSDELDPASRSGAELTRVAQGTLDFVDGRLDVVTKIDQSTMTFTGASVQEINFDFGDAMTQNPVGQTSPNGTGTLASPTGEGSQIKRVDVDGYPAGTLQDFQIGTDGTITGSFSNGQQRAIGAVALASFESDNGLEALGGNLFAATDQSGQPLIGSPGSGGRGQLVAGALEQSNVEMTEEFVNLIALQRAFQANSRTITTADQLMTEALGLKR